MTRADLADKLARRAGLGPAAARLAVQAILDGIAGALQRGHKVEIRGFGSFRVRLRRPYGGRNPRTGARVEVPEKKIVRFRPGKELSRLLG